MLKNTQNYTLHVYAFFLLFSLISLDYRVKSLLWKKVCVIFNISLYLLEVAKPSSPTGARMLHIHDPSSKAEAQVYTMSIQMYMAGHAY